MVPESYLVHQMIKKPTLGKPNQRSKAVFILTWWTMVLGYCSGALATEQQNSLYFDRILTESIRIERGISNNTVNTILQDDRGFMWFGTIDGLNRYDGYSFKVFNKDHGLSNESVRDLLQSGDSLWIGTEYGLSFLNLTTGQISSVYHRDDGHSVSENWINDLYTDHKGSVWICSETGLDVFERSSRTFNHIDLLEHTFQLPVIQYNAILQDNKGFYYIATDKGLFKVNESFDQCERFTESILSKTSLPSNQVNCLLLTDSTNLFIGTRKGLCSFDLIKNTVSNHYFNPLMGDAHEKDEILSLENNPGQGIWIGTFDQGLLYYNLTTHSIDTYKTNGSQVFSLSNNRIQCLFRSDQDILWIGTFSGLNKLDKNAPKFRSFRISNDMISGLSQNQVWCFTEYQQGKILVGTDHGLSYYDKTKASLSEDYPPGDLFMILKNKQIRALFVDSKRQLWVGTRYSGLFLFDSNLRFIRNFIHDPAKPKSLSYNYILDIIEDKSHQIWISSGKGLNRYRVETSDFVSYYGNDSLKGALPDNKVYDLCLSAEGVLWISTASGLVRYNASTGTFSRFLIPKYTDSLLNKATNVFYSVLSENEDVFWLGTRGGGIVKLNTQTGESRIFTVEDGLTDNFIYMMLKDREGRYWITTNWGLSRYDVTTGGFSNFDVSDGLQGNEFNWNAGFIDSEGEMYFGGLNGFNVFFPEEILTRAGRQKLRITEFRKFNSIQELDVEHNDTIRLRYDENFFSFVFSSLDYTNPAKNKYRYRLEGYDANWIEKDANHRMAEYSKVPPGNYHFRLMSRDAAGHWNKVSLHVLVIISPPWYMTWVFRVSVFALGILLIYAFVTLRINFVRKAHAAEKQIFEIEKQLYQLEQKALQLQMNPHFLFNSLNSIQGLILNNDINSAVRYLSKFSHLMRQTLNNSSESLIPARNELNALRLYLEIESLRFGDRFSFDLDIDPALDEDFVEIPPMILQPYVENAIVHGLLNSKKKGHLSIQLTVNGSRLHCTIEDNGVGREKAAEIRRESGIERKSKGMKITGERLAILNQMTREDYHVHVTDLFDQNGLASGTRVEIDMHMG